MSFSGDCGLASFGHAKLNVVTMHMAPDTAVIGRGEGILYRMNIEDGCFLDPVHDHSAINDKITVTDGPRSIDFQINDPVFRSDFSDDARGFQAIDPFGLPGYVTRNGD